MVERDKVREFLTEVEQLWDGPLMKTVPKAVRDWARSRVMGEALDELRRLVHGEQEGARYNGHYGSVCYHPSGK